MFVVYVTTVMWSIIQTMTTIDASASPVNSSAPRFGTIRAVKIFSPELAGWRSSHFIIIIIITYLSRAHCQYGIVIMWFTK